MTHAPKGRGFLPERELASPGERVGLGLAPAELVFRNAVLNHLLMSNSECSTSVMLAWDGYQGSRELKGEKEEEHAG